LKREREREREQPKFWIEGQDWKKRDQIKKWIKKNQENEEKLKKIKIMDLRMKLKKKLIKG
jgi:hypothetical protein